MKAHY